MRRMLTVAVGTMLSVSAAGVRAQAPNAAQTPDGDEIAKLVAANNLEVKGNTPFHLTMTFQLFDLKGKPKETGSLEEWWAAPGSSRLIVHLAGLNEDGSAADGAAPAVVRDVYLVGDLIGLAVHPVGGWQRVSGTLRDETEKFGKTSLRCISPWHGSVLGPRGESATLCMDPQMEDLRVVMDSDGNRIEFRNSVGKFHDTYVGLGLQISMLGQSAITGKVTALQSFDPVKAEVKLPTPASDAASPDGEAKHIPAAVMAGRRVHFSEPMYPDMAKIQHLSGVVVLGAMIGREGAIENLTPIASTDAMFTDAAMRAVQQWRYSPYLLNGEPTEVDTTITVNFALNPR
jgi:TonB family protein